MKRGIHIFPVGRTILLGLSLLAMAGTGRAQATDKGLQDKANALFDKGEYAAAYPMYSQLVSLNPQDHDLNYRFGACTLYGEDDKAKAIGYLKFAVKDPSTPALAWYFLGRAYQLDYHFDEAIDAYQHYRGTADKKVLSRFPVEALVQQCRNGKFLLTNLKDIEVLNKVEVASSDFFRFYDLSDIGGKIVVTPEELLTSLDRKNGGRSLTYLPAAGGPIYFSSYGKDGRTGKDIYRSELLPTGGYSTPVKLAGYINTDQDEDYAVMAPDGKTFYFCSKGHNSMGGYDVFKSTYDKGMDTFSAPENMDFAVNTPADELLYIVGPDGKEACFASDRDSRQGMVNVYRVGTTQTPLHMTILKGTYASAFDPSDRHARIKVEDGVTHEQVADVTTDINGNYLLALPRGGTYKFLVEGGPSGLAHFSTVDVPPAEVPKVYRQEMKLVEQGGEKLVIKNYFDEPLPDDVMALAMDEIRRRSHLDITGQKTVPQVAQQTATNDPVQAAGFDGTVTLDEAVSMAATRADGLKKTADAEKQQAGVAFAMAQESLAKAEAEAEEARSLVQRSTGTAQDRKGTLLRQAAEAKERSRQASLRAEAAFRTAMDLRQASERTRVSAHTADSLASTLARAKTANDHAALTTGLTALKAGLDRDKGPQHVPDEAERTRRAAAEATESADRKLRQANAQREDENNLDDRLARNKRELDAAKGGRKKELAKDRSELQGQRDALHDEVEEAFAKARAAEEQAALARGQASLVNYLGANAGTTAGATMNKDLIAGMEKRLADLKARSQTLVIDPQYTPVQVSAQEMERRIFDWGINEPLAKVPNQSTGTIAATNTVGNSAVGRTDTTTSTLPSATGGAAGQVGKDSTALAAAVDTAAGTQGRETSAAVPATMGTQAVQADSASLALVQQPGSTTDDGAIGVQDQARGTNVLAGTSGKDNTEATTVTNTPAAPQGVAKGDSINVAAQVPTTAANNGSDGSSDSANAKEEQAFLLANKLAELEQLREGAKHGRERDSLDQAIADQKKLLAEFQAEGTGSPSKEQPDVAITAPEPEYRPLDYDPSVLNEQLAEELYPGFALRRQEIMNSPGEAGQKANRLHALEMQLVDSIDARSSAITARLKAAPAQADSLLPVLDHLRQLKATHVELADKALAQADKTYQASETKAMEDAMLNATSSPAETPADQPVSPTPHSDAYLTIRPEMDRVYGSLLAPRGTKDKEAVEEQQRGLEQADGMKAEIDSMENVLSGLPAGRDYDKLRERTDRKIDDMLIHLTDLGQRSAFITRSEYDLARDSANTLNKSIAKRGLAPDEPLLQMVKTLQGSAQAGMDHAKQVRKDADRSEDVLQRNNLYRQAYAEELRALRDMDRSLTVGNYLLSGQSRPGEALTYEEVEARMFPTQIAQAGSSTSKQAGQGTEPSAANDTLATAMKPAEMNELSSVQPKSTVDSSSTVVAAGKEQAQPASAAGRIVEIGGIAGSGQGSSQQAADSTLLSGYLDKYYYLGPEDRAKVLVGTDERRYFMMKGRSLEGQANADAALSEAAGSTRLATELRHQATELRNDAQPDNDGKASLLDSRATALEHRSDSLRSAADRLRSMASTDDAQAATWLQSLPVDRSAAIMDLEQRSRRTEPLLARTRPSATVEIPTANAAGEGTRTDSVQASAPAVSAPSPRQSSGVERLASANSVAHPEPQPFTGPLTQNIFTFNGETTERKEAIPIDAPMPQGVVYKVQVGAFRNPLPMEAFSDMAPVTGEHAANGLVRYTAGLFVDAKSAAEAGAKVRARGYRDAFVAAYIDGKRVPLREAMRAEASREGLAVNTPTTAGGTGSQAIAPAPVQLPQASAEESVLAQYPATAEAVLAAFQPASTAYYNDPTAAPAKQVETVKGLFFTVQVGVYSKPTPLDKLFNITPLNSEFTANGKIRYTTGMFGDEGKAQARRTVTVSLGVKDAFITAYLNGKRIPMRDARALLAKYGSAVLAAGLASQ